MANYQEMITLEYKPQPMPVGFPDYKNLKGEIQEELSLIENEIVTLETVHSAKENKAYLNKLLDRLKKNRLDTQKIILSEFRDFESKSKALEGMVSEAISTLDEKIRKLDSPEPKKEHTLKFTCTEKQLATLLKTFERQGIDVLVDPEDDNPPMTPPAPPTQKTEPSTEIPHETESLPVREPVEKTEPEPKPELKPEPKPKATKGKDVFDEFMKAQAKDEKPQSPSPGEIQKQDLTKRIRELQTLTDVSDEKLEKGMGKPFASMSDGDLRRCHDLLRKRAAMLRISGKGA